MVTSWGSPMVQRRATRAKWGRRTSMRGLQSLCLLMMAKGFHSVAYLQQIWWFEVVGEVDFCFPPGTYSLYLRLHLGKYLQLGTNSWVGQEACTLPVLDIRRAAFVVPVLLRRAWELVILSHQVPKKR